MPSPNSSCNAKTPGLLVLLLLCFAATATAQQSAPRKVQVFILAGQSNMVGKGSVYTMQQQLMDPAKKSRFEHLQEGDQWAQRDDVSIHYLGGQGRRSGPLTVGYGVSREGNSDWFGPELGFGWTVGEALDAPVLIIKTAWGGKSIDRDFRPPSRGYPESIAQALEQAQKRDPEATMDSIKQSYGHFYRQMTAEISQVTADIGKYVPDYEGQGFEIRGFVWFQGWNDQYAPTSVEDYEENLAALIRDLRAELGQPDLPVVIGAMGHNGDQQKGKIKQIADAQAAVAEREEFEGSVTTIRTAQYWDTEAEEAYDLYWANEKTRDVDQWRKFGNDRGYHYLGSPVFFLKAGNGFGEAMLKLLDK